MYFIIYNSCFKSKLFLGHPVFYYFCYLWQYLFLDFFLLFWLRMAQRSEGGDEERPREGKREEGRGGEGNEDCYVIAKHWLFVCLIWSLFVDCFLTNYSRFLVLCRYVKVFAKVIFEIIISILFCIWKKV